MNFSLGVCSHIACVHQSAKRTYTSRLLKTLVVSTSIRLHISVPVLIYLLFRMLLLTLCHVDSKKEQDVTIQGGKVKITIDGEDLTAAIAG